MSSRYHQAAVDSNLELLKEATRKDLNTLDADGMTPTLQAAYHGNLEALEVICRRGGDPDKCDIWGNTPLHHAASNGHLHCVTFLINFGANIFALDNDLRSPLDAAASRYQYECVRVLDNAATEQSTKNPRRASRLKAQAQRDIEKQIRACERRQEKHQHHMARSHGKGSVSSAGGADTRAKVSSFFTSSSLSALPKQLKDTFKLRSKKKEENSDPPETGANGRDSSTFAGRTTAMDVFSEEEEEEALSSDFQRQASLSEDDGQLGPKSIFHLPGLGQMVFRHNVPLGLDAELALHEKDNSFRIPAELLQLEESKTAGDTDAENVPEEPWVEEEIRWDDEEVETPPLEVFLACQNLSEYLPTLIRENLDLEALMLCSDEDLQSIQMQLGPRKKVLHAISRRKEVLARPGKTEDTQL
ncbi:ankyrin repeat and SAM domain-containing protein 4B [Tiliqua scincoides]|uniref:ankyrin repeat and SAM domain-containing protein 4B n=1 Tax=Tiliqua scincoides TaxID=71010 RepID=UPI003462B91C